MNLIGIDFEDWYHPELVKKYVKDKTHEPLMHKGLDKIIELLRKNETLATFFVVGELIENNPEIVDKLLDNDHEIGFHTMHHDRIDSLGFREKFSEEIKQFSELTNKKSRGFRAPTFSLNNDSSWIIDTLIEHGYVYDSSIVPAKLDLYGLPNAEVKPYRISSENIDKNSENAKLIEFPLMITKFLGKKIPAGGGFFLRTLPGKIIKNAIKKYQNQNMPATFYIHSWELTPEYMPKIKLPQKENFVTYHNINKAYEKMNSILKEFEFTSFSNYISKNM